MDNSYINPKGRNWFKRLIFLIVFLVLGIIAVIVGRNLIDHHNLEKTDFISKKLSDEIVKPDSLAIDKNNDNLLQSSSDKNSTEFVPDLDQDFISDKDDSENSDNADNSSENDEKSVAVSEDQTNLDDNVEKDTIEKFSHSVEKGDTIESILLTSGLSSEFISSFSKKFPELEKINPEQDFSWETKNDELTFLSFVVSSRQENTYQLQADGSFKRTILKKQSTWKNEVISGNITSSFYSSLEKLGLSPAIASVANKALQWQLDLRKLLAGDKFYIYINREYIDEKMTGKAQLLAVKIKSRGKSYYAFKAKDGKFYNEKGDMSTSVTQFRRYPLNFQPRISSKFNLRRRHPITKRISPHKGVDFAVKSGTSVIAPANGKVIKIAYQANGAGRYIVIQHSSKYRTVYMHLSRALVKVGQQVKRGQRIALSGNTGRSTGPHLHYEFHVNGKPVDPMRVKLPGFSQALSSKDKKVYLATIKPIKAKLDAEK